ncbi:hypothetical protein [Maridesulfovibrio sp.]|uniref:hypothetical protein n=1 Tax=Maridesulfovibrio sp. TaxID=2795000 RepID=UPI002AA63D24|nr:hypothetical protein [Maridesulfovibrio sp.]
MKKILVVTSSNDRTVDYIQSKYRDVCFIRFNVDLFYEYKIVVTNDSIKLSCNEYEYTLSSQDAIYYRKPNLPDLTNVLSNEYHDFVYREVFSTMDGIVELHSGVCLTKPSLLRKANNKIYQVCVARKIGFNLPKMAITNSRDDIKAFLADESIVKPIASGEIIHTNEKEFVQTNLIDATLSLDKLRYCPAYFQLFVRKDFDVRIVFVGRKAFSFAIYSTNNVDWRKPDAENKYSVIEIPSQIYSMCCEMLDEVGMRFGCFDFIVKGTDYYFLELNANGQWAWLEFETGINISGEIVRELLYG